MKQRQVLFAIAMILMLWLVNSRNGEAQQLAVSPAYLELDLKERASGTFVITNVTDSELRCRAQAIHWRFSKNGQIEEIPADRHSLTSWIKFNPKEFTLPPKASQNVRYSVIPGGRLEVGEYWGGIHFEPLDVEKANLIGTSNGLSASVKVITSILVPIFGKYGDFDSAARLDTLRITVTDKGILIKSVIANTGRGGLRLGGDYEIVDASGKVVATEKLPATFILPEGELIFSTLVKESLPQGAYMAKVRYRDRQTNQLITSGETVFEVGTLDR